MFNKKLTNIAKISLLTAALAATSSVFADATKVALIYVGPTGDHGWTYQHNEGANYVKAHMGDDVEITYIESVPEGPDAERVIRQLANKGNDIIFTTSFGYMNPTLKVAKLFPDVKFEHATGYMRSDNVSIYSARFYEGRHVIGKIAGEMTKSNIIGYIASFPIPEVIRGINASYMAAKSVNPDVQMKIVWVYTWFDPGKESDAANALIDQGADILMQHTDSAAAMLVAEEKGIYAFGQASDMSAFGPNAQLTAIIDDWGPYYLQRVLAARYGTWESTDTFDGTKEGMVGFAPLSDKLPADVKAMAQKTIDGLRAGTVDVFAGPINRQDGSEWVKAGESAPLGDLLGMNFYVEGIEGSIPK